MVAALCERKEWSSATEFPAQREHDTESGLVYMRHRMYDPRIGRFTQIDPLFGSRPFEHYVYACNNPISGSDPTGLIVQFTRTQGSSRRDAEAKALADWVGYDLHVTGAGIVTITGKRSGNLDGGSLPGEFEAMVSSKTVYSVEDIFQRVLKYNSAGRDLFDLATDYYSQMRPDMLDTWGAGFNRGAAAGAENWKEGVTLGVYQAPQWAKDDPAAGFSRLMGNVTLAAALAPVAASATPAAATTMSIGGTTATTTAVTVGGAVMNRLGQMGERAVRTVADFGPKVKIAIAGRARIPDGLTNTVLTEVKNVRALSYTQQLRDYADYAMQNLLRFDLWVRPNTTLSAPLEKAVEAGIINLRQIP